MTKSTLKLALALIAGGLFASTAYAEPVSLSSAQLDSIAAGGETTDSGFVCPVITTVNVLNAASGEGVAAMPLVEGETYTVAPSGASGLTVPLHATNADGAGFPSNDSSDFSAPGDTDYTAIWSGQ